MSDATFNRGSQITRVALLVCLAFALLLAATMILARSAEALTLGSGLLPSGTSVAPAPVEAGDEEAEEWESWEEGEWEDEEDEEEAAENAGRKNGKTIYIAPAECLLRTADAKAVVYSTQDKVSMTIHYTALSPIDVMVDYRFRGAKGSLSLNGAGHFGKRGVFHQVERLSKAQTAKALGAKEVTVQLRLPAVPEGCDNGTYLRHLSSKRALSNQVSWSDSLARPTRHRP